MLLQIAVAVPLAAAALMLFSGRFSAGVRKAVAGLGFCVPAVLALALFALFPSAEKLGGYAFVSGCESFGVPELGVWLQFGLNGISLPLFLMAAFVGAAAGIRALSTKDVAQPGLYFAVILVMFGGVLGVFSAIDVFSFYIFHEFALIPTFIAILLWGGYARKTTALTMAIYLTLGAMVSLAGLVALYFALPETYPFSFLGIRDAVVAGEIFDGNVSVVFALLLFGFGILVSLFPFHTWAPDTYASAPTPVSMLHAGVLKKFGLYGLIQLGALALPLGLAEWQNWIIWLALGNIVLIGLIAMTQKDLKQMVAYSSVMHMGPIFLGIAAFAISGGNAAGLGVRNGENGRADGESAGACGVFRRGDDGEHRASGLRQLLGRTHDFRLARANPAFLAAGRHCAFHRDFRDLRSARRREDFLRKKFRDRAHGGTV